MKELHALRKASEAASTVEELRPLFDKLFAVLEQQVARCTRLEKENERLRKRVEELESGGGAPPLETTQPDQSYSAETVNERKKRRTKLKKKTGRKPGKDKLRCVARWEDVLPEDASKDDCELQLERPIWRIEDGRATLVGYRVYRRPWQDAPRIPGVLPRCEYAVEIHVLLAYLVYIIGVSIDKACQLLNFFCELPIARSQADAMLTQLGKHWEDDFDAICDQLVHAAVVHADETSWRVGRLNSSIWSFTSQLQCVMLFGCSKNRATLESILPPDDFEGTVVSDNAAVYSSGYSSQKCWAHLIRKAVKCCLLAPNNKRYRQFLDDLVTLYRDAKKIAADKRYATERRAQEVAQLESRLCDLCHPHWPPMNPKLKAPATKVEKDFRGLVNELLDLVVAEQLFVFVEDPQVASTNNTAERQLRNSALARKANRTNKTDTGSQRQTRIMSVLETMRLSLPQFSMGAVVAKVVGCLSLGTGLFTTEPAALSGES